jgi:hypothetical protein
MWLLPDENGNTTLKLDLRTASYDEILEVWSNQHTDDGTNDGQYKIHKDGTTYHVIVDYFNQDKFKK